MHFRIPMKPGTRHAIWMDHRHATLINLDRNGTVNSIQEIASEIDPKHRAAGGSGSPVPYGPHQGGRGEKDTRKRKGQIRRFYDELSSSIKTAEHVLLLGPTFAKDEFARHLRRKGIHRDLRICIRSSGRMTRRQKRAAALLHFKELPCLRHRTG